MKLQQKTLAAAILLCSTAAFAANPTKLSDENSTPITVGGEIIEVVACKFSGSAASGLTLNFGAADSPYETEATEDLTVTCQDDATGQNYRVAMTVGTSADYISSSSSIALKIGAVGSEVDKTAVLQASEDDGATYKDVSTIDTLLGGQDSQVYKFKATIQAPGTVTGAVAADTSSGAQNLYVKFDQEAPEEPEDDSDFGDFPDFPPAS